MNGKSVLLVDDNTDIQTVIKISMEQLGHSVHFFSTGKDAIAALDDVRPEVAIVDYGLPDMTGTEVGRAIRSWESEKRIRLVMFSGTVDAELKSEADEVGFDAYLLKPVRIQALREAAGVI